MADNPEIFEPFYNIKAISQLVGLLPVTLRAWERRYGLPKPIRGVQGYRYYSEYDLKTLLWIKTQLAFGLSISLIIENLKRLRNTGNDPVVIEAFGTVPEPTTIPETNQSE
jgi:MerR family transcriptional regulator, light-induced transcriptional regulator